MRYLACYKPGPISHTSWETFVKHIEAVVSKCPSMNPCSSSTSVAEEREPSTTVHSCSPSTLLLEGHRAVLDRKLKKFETRKSYGNDLHLRLWKLLCDEKERLERETDYGRLKKRKLKIIEMKKNSVMNDMVE